MKFLSVSFNYTGSYTVIAQGIDRRANFYLFNVSKNVHIRGKCNTICDRIMSLCYILVEQQMLYIVEETGYIGVNEIIQFVLFQVPVSNNYVTFYNYI